MKIQDLIGKTISSASIMRREGLDDEGWLRIEFTDNTVCVIVSSYGGYTGNSDDEYPTYIDVDDDIAGLVPVAIND